MLDTQQGLTKTYNALKDPSCSDRRILALREQHEAMDAAVLAEYGWDNLKVPPFCAKSDADTRAQETFKSKVIDLLYALNAERAREEARLGLGGGKGKGKQAAKAPVDNDNAAVRAKPQPKAASNGVPGPVSTRPSGRAAKKAGAQR